MQQSVSPPALIQFWKFNICIRTHQLISSSIFVVEPSFLVRSQHDLIPFLKDAGPLIRSVNQELTSPRLRKSLTTLFSSSDFSIYQPGIEVVDPLSGFKLNSIQDYKQAGCRQTSRKYTALKRCNGQSNDQGASGDIGMARSASALWKSRRCLGIVLQHYRVDGWLIRRGLHLVSLPG